MIHKFLVSLYFYLLKICKITWIIGQLSVLGLCTDILLALTGSQFDEILFEILVTFHFFS